MDDAGPQSLFVVVSWECMAPCSISILQLETQEHNHEYAAHLTPKWRSPIKRRPSFSSLETQLNQKEYVAHFGPPQGSATIRWVFSPLTSSTPTEELYMVPYWDPKDHKIDVPLHGCIFNLRTKTHRPSKPPRASKFDGHVVNLGGCFYFMAQPHWHVHTPDPVFERYDPANDSWKTLEPFPYHAVCQLGSKGHIEATASWDDTILFNMGGCEIWAYNVPKDKWYIVDVEDVRCYSIVGEAVVLENTIYALTKLSFGLVLALSIERDAIDGDLVFKCSLRSRILVPDMKPISFKDVTAYWRTRHLVHLGKDNFCLVQSCKLDGFNDYQPIQLTNIKLKEENSMTVTGVCVHLLRILDDMQFHVSFCFSLPECKTTALKEGKRFLFDLDPFPQGFAPKQKGKTVFVTTLPKDRPLFNVQATSELQFQDNDSSQTNINEEGHSIYVRNLPPDATFKQLEEGLKKFGPVKRDGIQVIINDTGNPYAFVEFNSATSKQRAIQASAIIIMGCRAVIEEKRRGFFPVDCNRTSGSSSSGKIKFKNHGEISRSKTTCGWEMVL